MQIFEQEKLDGLEHAIASSSSILCASIVEPAQYTKANKNIQYMKSIASISDKDLYYVQSILVSSSWNKNDDIFDKNEVWVAKNTPEDKPTNLEHNESLIIGHITSNWPITEDGILIDQDTPAENLPEKYHILTGSVIYRGFSNPDLRERAEKLISEIENGTKYVSMECFFNGFDYGVLNTQTNEYKVLARNEETAHLTKYLRSYGGMGQHDKYKLGRVLRNITFTGKGFVDKPANVDSIIFTKNLISEHNIASHLGDKIEKKEKITILGVSTSQSNIKSENKTMSLENEVVEPQTEAAEMPKECAEATEAVMSQISELNTQISELKSANEQLQASLAELTQTKDNEITALKEEAAKKMKEDEDSKDEENKNLKAALDAANETIAAYKNKEAEMAKKEKKMKRVASLVEVGMDAESATSTVEKFESLDDEAFDAMTSLFAGKMPPWLEKNKKGDEPSKDKEEEKKKASEDITDPSILDTVEVEAEVNLGIGGEVEPEINSTRAALETFVRSRLGKKHN